MYNAQKTKSKSLIPERKRGVVRVLSLFLIGLPAFVRAYVYTELHTKHEIVYLLIEAFVAPISTAACLFYIASTDILDDIQAVKFHRDTNLNVMVNVFLCGRLVPQLFGHLQN